MNTQTARKIERYARVNGMSFAQAASEIGRRGARARQAKARRKSAAEINQVRFEKMRASQPQLY